MKKFSILWFFVFSCLSAEVYVKFNVKQDTNDWSGESRITASATVRASSKTYSFLKLYGSKSSDDFYPDGHLLAQLYSRWFHPNGGNLYVEFFHGDYWSDVSYLTSLQFLKYDGNYYRYFSVGDANKDFLDGATKLIIVMVSGDPSPKDSFVFDKNDIAELQKVMTYQFQKEK